MSSLRQPIRLAVVLSLSVFAIEGVIMYVLTLLPPLSPAVEGVVDGALLVALLFPLLLILVVRPLAQLVADHQRAADALREHRELLEQRVRERTAALEQRNDEARQLAEMGDLLQACASVEEACRVIASAAEQLLPADAGALYVYSPSRNDLEGLASWGGFAAGPTDQAFAPEQCWALRRGRAHSVANGKGGPCCAHVPAPLCGVYACIPMIAHGEVLGVVHVRRDPARTADAGGLEESVRLATALAEHVALALTNLRLRETLRHQSIRDPLTGLYNRRYMEETLERELRRAERESTCLGVVLLDLDHFKRFNDTFGHEAGDVVLREVGALLKSHVRAGDIACRQGGEEFVLLLPDTPESAVVERAEQVRAAIRQLNVRHRDQALGIITVSAGVSTFPSTGDSAQSLLRAADQALYRAKSEGRDRVVLGWRPGAE